MDGFFSIGMEMEGNLQLDYPAKEIIYREDSIVDFRCPNLWMAFSFFLDLLYKFLI